MILRAENARSAALLDSWALRGDAKTAALGFGLLFSKVRNARALKKDGRRDTGSPCRFHWSNPLRETLRRIRRRVQAVDGVKECVDVRMTLTRRKPHVHVQVSSKGDPDYDGIHKVSAIIDHEVRKVVPNARVSIRSEPGEGGAEG